MTKRFQKLFRRLQKQSGQSLVEYALILALVSIVAILVLKGSVPVSIPSWST